MSVGNWDQHRATSFKWKEKKQKKIAATLFPIFKKLFIAWLLLKLILGNYIFIYCRFLNR